MSTSQNGWPANDRTRIAAYTIPGTAQRLGIAKGDPATVLLYVAARFHREVEPLHVGWCWGYAERNIRGSSTTLSNHASGTAIDLNAPAHPLGTNPGSNYSPAQIAAVHRILDECVVDGVRVVRWGGDYHGRKDGMHFELNAGASSVARLAARLRAPQEASAVPRTGPTVKGWQALLAFAPWRRDGAWGPDTDQRSTWLRNTAVHRDGIVAGSARSTIRTVQRVVGTPDDGVYGPATDRAVTAWVRRAQAFLGVVVDGVWGPRTDAAYQAFRRENHR